MVGASCGGWSTLAAAQVGFWAQLDRFGRAPHLLGDPGELMRQIGKGAGRRGEPTTNVFLVAPLWALARPLGGTRSPGARCSPWMLALVAHRSMGICLGQAVFVVAGAASCCLWILPSRAYISPCNRGPIAVSTRRAAAWDSVAAPAVFEACGSLLSAPLACAEPRPFHER